MTDVRAEESSAVSLSPLTVRVGSTSVSLDPRDAPAVIGRRDPAAADPVWLPINDDRISRVHLVLEVRDDVWWAIPRGRNGTFIDGAPQTEAFPLPDEGLTVALGNGFAGIPVQFSTLDPSVVFAGAQVAQRRTELDISQRTLAANRVINAGALISFEKGRSWPRQQTQHRLEEVLGWPRGHIAALRNQHRAQTPAETPEPEGPTMIVGAATGADTLETHYLAQTVELALGSIQAGVEDLPDPTSRDFQRRADRLLDDLARLEKLASNATRGAAGAESVFQQLSAVRRARRTLILRAAAAPTAALGLRVYAARTTADLSTAEAATMVGLRAEDVAAAESGVAPPPGHVAALQRLITLLA